MVDSEQFQGNTPERARNTEAVAITAQWSHVNSFTAAASERAWPLITTGGSGPDGSVDDRYPAWVSALVLVALSGIFWVGLLTLIRGVFPF